jgi:hypothetical protein
MSQTTAVAAQDERQLHVSRQLASSRQAKPSVARRLLVDADADGAHVSKVPECTLQPLPWRNKSEHVSKMGGDAAVHAQHRSEVAWPFAVHADAHCSSGKSVRSTGCYLAFAADTLAADERAAVESPTKKRRGEVKAAEAPSGRGKADPSNGVGKEPPTLLPPSAYSMPRGRVFAVNGLHVTPTDLAHAPALLAAAPSVHGGAPANARPEATRSLGSTYVRMRLDALLSSI